MYKINYYYSSLSKQFFLIIFITYTITRIVLFHIGGFSEYYYPILSTLMYLLIISFCIFLLNGYKYYYVQFDETTISIHNRIIKKSISYSIADIQKADFTRLGIKIYTHNSNKYDIIIPIYFFGKMSPIGCENFEIMLKNMNVGSINKSYQILPGYGMYSTIVGYIFFFLCIPLLLSTVQLIEIIYLIHISA